MASSIPLLEEQLDLATRAVETGQVRVHKVVSAHDELVDLSLRRDDVDIQRVSVNRAVAEAQPVRTEGDVTIVPLHAEVVTTQLVVTDELHIRMRSSRMQASQRVTLRREDVEVTRDRADAGAGAAPQSTHPPPAP